MVQAQQLTLVANNSSTILSRIIEIITRRRLNICYLLARVNDTETDQILVDIEIEATDDHLRLLRPQLEKQIDVVSCKQASADHI